MYGGDENAIAGLHRPAIERGSVAVSRPVVVQPARVVGEISRDEFLKGSVDRRFIGEDRRDAKRLQRRVCPHAHAPGDEDGALADR